DRTVVKPGQIGSSSPAIVIRDTIIMGAALLGGTAPPSKENVPGYIRGFDVRTGKRLWTFRTIPHPGEFGNETWEKDSWKYTGNTGAWAPLSADEELGYVYIPVEMPTGDFYGGNRPGNTLFSDSLVCLDARTGKRVWHYQLVHHDIWDWDIAAPPLLVDYTPALKEEAIKIASQYKLGPLYTPPIIPDTDGKAALFLLPAHVGGVNWPGGAVDAETGIMYVASVTQSEFLAVSKADPA